MYDKKIEERVDWEIANFLEDEYAAQGDGLYQWYRYGSPRGAPLPAMPQLPAMPRTYLDLGAGRARVCIQLVVAFDWA